MQRTLPLIRTAVILAFGVLITVPQASAQQDVALRFYDSHNKVECEGAFFEGPPRGALSIDWWLNLNSFDAGANIGATTELGQSWASEFFTFRILDGGAKVRVGEQSGRRLDIEDHGISLQTWHHMAYVHDGLTARFYVDGIQRGSAGEYGLPSLPMSSFVFSSNTEDNRLIGTLDEVRIWNIALAPHQLDQTVTGVEPEIVAYYKFDGQTLKDWTNKGPDCELGSSPAVFVLSDRNE